MFVRVLGSAAGGGFPQWNCGCVNCAGVRSGAVRAVPRTQESLAVSGDGERWVLLNASPEIRGQIESFPKLHPRGPRDSPISAIVLTNGDLDHCLGLLSLRESHPLEVFATRAVEEGFRDGNVLYRTMERFDGQVRWRRLALEQTVELPGGLELTAWGAPGKLPLHLADRRAPSPEDNLGLRLRERGGSASLAYLPALGQVGDRERRAAGEASCVFLDGTFWSSDELRQVDPRAPLAEAMAHQPVGGPGGSLAALSGSSAHHRFLIHVNNTNPVLRDDSPERAAVRKAGWEVAWDGWSWCCECPGVREEFVEQLRREGERRYHDRHPFNLRMHEGALSREELQRWVENRYYYQTRIPIKDALIVSKSEDRAFRRMWIHRIHDHDGVDRDDGGLAEWLGLAKGVGLDPAEVESCRRVLPGVRFACDAYVTFVREASLLEAVASSLTEFFAPAIMTQRVAAWERHYPWIGPEALGYFKSRVSRAQRDSGQAVAWVAERANTRAEQDACVAALIRKTEILWHLLDCVDGKAAPR